MKRIAIVTGCAKGIGREIALELARNCYDIIGTYNGSKKAIKEVEKKINFLGVKFYSYKVDLLDDKEIVDFCNYVNYNFNHIDLLVNNAALSLDNEFDLKTSEEFMDVLKVNLVGPFTLTQKLYKLMKKGVIVNISSTDGINTYTKLNIDYSASKAGLINLTKSLSLVLENIKVYAICPNWVKTESILEMNQEYLNDELKRIGQKQLIEPKTIAIKLIELLNGDYESGSILKVDDGYDE